jgi:hypothetical protein
VLLRLAYLTVTNTFAVLRPLPMSDRDKDAEILALRHQLAVLQRHLGPSAVTFTPVDRAFLAALLQPLPRTVLRQLQLLVRPDTVLRWHRNLMKQRHADNSKRKRPGRPPTVRSIRALVLRRLCCIKRSSRSLAGRLLARSTTSTQRAGKDRTNRVLLSAPHGDLMAPCAPFSSLQWRICGDENAGRLNATVPFTALRADAVVLIGAAHWLHVPVGKLREDRYLPLHPHLFPLIADYRTRHVTTDNPCYCRVRTAGRWIDTPSPG